MADVTEPHLRATIYGLDRMFEGLVSPAGGFVAGAIAEGFGFQYSTQGGCAGDIGDSGGGNHSGGSSSSSNADALGHALAITMAAPWALCFAAYSLLHCTYASDRAAATARRARVHENAAGEGPEVELRVNDGASSSSWNIRTSSAVL